MSRETRDSRRKVVAVSSTPSTTGAWVETGRLRYHGKGDDTRRVIESQTFIRNVRVLSEYLSAVRHLKLK